MIDEAIRNPLINAHYAYVSPTYAQSKKVNWEYIQQYTRDIPGCEAKQGDLKIEISRPRGMAKINQNLEWTTEPDTITIWLLGADNPDSLRGVYMDGIILDEYADQNPIIWSQIFRPALSDRYTMSMKAREKFGIDSCRIQGWAIFISTPKPNHFKDLYEMAKTDPKWHTFLLPADKSGIIPPEELEDMKKIMDEQEYNQEMLCNFNCNLTGSYFQKYIQELEDKGSIANIPHNPALPVALFFDLGISDSTAVWAVQKCGTGYNVINYFEFIGLGLESIIQTLFKLPYMYSSFNFPHDANKREFISGKSIIATAETLGCRPSRLIPRCKQKSDMITASRLLLPQCKFDSNNCRDGLNALKSYQRDYDPEKKVFKDAPRHDWCSHAADAFGYFAMGVNDSTFIRAYEQSNNLPSQAVTEYNIFG